jgi:curved DNA-binding protein CbpA
MSFYVGSAPRRTLGCASVIGFAAGVRVRDFYKVLGIAATADEIRIKSAFRRRAKALHPDLNPGDRRAEQAFKELTQAYEILRNAQARASYDALLADRRSAARRRFAASATLMVASFLLTMGSAFAVLGWRDGAAAWANLELAKSWQQAGETATSLVARQIGNAADGIAHVAAAILASATTAPPARPPGNGTEIARAAVDVVPNEAAPAAAKTATPRQRKRQAETPSSTKAERKPAASTHAQKRFRASAERREPAARVTAPTRDAGQQWPTTDEPMMSLGATRR